MGFYQAVLLYKDKQGETSVVPLEMHADYTNDMALEIT